MIYPDISVEKWILKYPTLSIKERQCHQCRSSVSVDTPWITKDYAGIEKTHCNFCNTKIGMSVATPISKKSKAAWGSL